MLRLAVLALFLSTSSALAAPPEGEPWQASLARIPLHFVENVGQAPAEACVLAVGAGPRVAFTARGVALSAGRGEGVLLTYAGSAGASHVETLHPLEGRANFYLGNDPERWQEGVALHGAVVHRQVWPGVDVVHEGQGGRLKSEFHLEPGVRPSIVRLRYEGATSLRVREDGALVVRAAGGDIVDEAPVAWQPAPGRRLPVRVAWKVLGRDEAAFEVGRHDRSLPLVIDPILDFSTYLGGSGDDEAAAYDGDQLGGASSWGSALFGSTASLDFPTLHAEWPSPGGGRDLWAMRISPSNHVILWSTYVGGSGDDEAVAFAHAGGSSMTLLGTTASSDFPVHPGNVLGHRGGKDACVVRFDPDTGRATTEIVFGGSGDDVLVARTGGSPDGTYIGTTTSPNLPLVEAFDTTLGGGQDAVLLQTYGGHGAMAIRTCTYIGGSGLEEGTGVVYLGRPSPDNALLVAGRTTSTDFPIYGTPFDSSLDGASDGFLLGIEQVGLRPPAGPGLDENVPGPSTFFGGAGDDAIATLATTLVDNELHAFVAGWTSSLDLPVADAFQDTLAGGTDAFFGTLALTLDAVRTLSYLGGSGDESDVIASPRAWEAYGQVGPQPLSGAFLAMTTTSPDLPVLEPLQGSLAGGSDAYVANLVLQPGRYRLYRASYLGGSGDEQVRFAVFDRGDTCVGLGGRTSSSDFPLADPLHDTLQGASDAFFASLCEHAQPPWGREDYSNWNVTAERLEDLHLKTDAIEAKFDALALDRGPSHEELAQSLEDLDEAVAALEAKLDALPDLHALRDEVRALEAKADATAAALGALEAKLDASAADDERRRLEDIEVLLQERHCIASLWLPVAQGGRLETALALVADLLARARASGDPSANVRVSEQKHADAQAAHAAGDFQRSCQVLSESLRALTWQ